MLKVVRFLCSDFKRIGTHKETCIMYVYSHYNASVYED